MGRDAGSHANGNATCPVDDKIGKSARQHDRLSVPLVISRHKVDGVEVQVIEHLRGDRREAGLCVPHRSGRQAGNRSKIALLVDQHMPHVPFLGHADKSRVDDTFTMGMVITAGVT